MTWRSAYCYKPRLSRSHRGKYLSLDPDYLWLGKKNRRCGGILESGCVQKRLKLEELRLRRSVQDDGRCGLGIDYFKIVEFRTDGITMSRLLATNTSLTTSAFPRSNPFR